LLTVLAIAKRKTGKRSTSPHALQHKIARSDESFRLDSSWGFKSPLFEASQSSEADTLLLAAVLFGLAVQVGQGNEQAMDSLKRMLESDIAFSVYETQDAFLSSPVVQATEVACRLRLRLPI
jgi:hypothetical protein